MFRRCRAALAGALVLAVAPFTIPASPVGATTAGAAQASLPSGLSALLAAHAPTDVTRAIATFNSVPSALQVTSLEGLGLTVQPMEHVSLAIVSGPVSAMQAAVSAGVANDVYPDEKIELLDETSADAMGAAAAREAGFTGKGVTVAVVDSGCDASHPDLADHVIHNVKVYSAEYVNLPADSTTRIVVPVEQGPYQNTDLGSGHGTHVAGIIAADGTTDPAHIGVAPDAELVCYSIGEILFTTAVVSAYDHLLDQPDLWGVDVINNSWGNSFRQFDPRDPVAVVTRAVSDLGVTVVFAAGNSGYANAEMSLNPFSAAPWVISVAAGTVDHQRGNFSSNGLQFDNSLPLPPGGGGYSLFTGDRIGVYHPDVTAPGVAISSSCDSAGTPVVIGPCPPPDYGNESASGTSMAAPHVAGAAAVLKQARPSLTATRLRNVLEATATPMATGFWQTGYGYVDLGAALTLVRSATFESDLATKLAAANKRVLAEDGINVRRSDFWTFDAPRIAVAGSDTRTFSAPVEARITKLKITLSHPSAAVIGDNRMQWTVTVKDAAGQVLGTTTEAADGAGTASVLIDLRATPVTYGTFTFEAVGQLAVSDPDTFDSESLLGRMVTLQVAHLLPS